MQILIGNLISRPLHLGSTFALLSIVTAGSLIGCGGDKKDDANGGGARGDISLDGLDRPRGPGSIGPDQKGGREEITRDQLNQILSAECTGWSGEGESVPATLELVIDVSGSMNSPPPGGAGGRSKWDITRDALSAAIASLPPSVSVGVLFYPHMTPISHSNTAPGPVTDCVDTAASIPLAQLGNDGSEQRTVFETALDSAYVDSYTPTHDAYKYALETKLIPYQAANKFILLITDGAPTLDLGCTWPVQPAVTGRLFDGAGVADGATDPIIADIAAARRDHGIRTFLIGAPGSERSVESNMDKRPWLSQAARAGGTDTPGCSENGPNYCHFDMALGTNFAAELTAGLANISGQIVDECTFVIPDAPSGETIEPADTQLIIEWGNGSTTIIYPDGTGDCTDGWEYNDADGTVVLCDQTCNEVKVDERSTIHVSFGCSSEQVEGIIR